MEFDNTFSVTAPIDDVWAAILDVARVAPPVPGARARTRTPPRRRRGRRARGGGRCAAACAGRAAGGGARAARPGDRWERARRPDARPARARRDAPCGRGGVLRARPAQRALSPTAPRSV